MKITSAEFVKSAFEKSHWPTDRLPEIAFLGRSNVGKSSLLNSLVQRKGLARTSNTPGRTQSINFFLINRSLYFVDLPGYGYAKVPKTMRKDWGRMAEEYLVERENLALAVQLVDSRLGPTELDLQLFEWLAAHRVPLTIVATKSDKLSSNALNKQLRSIEREMPGSIVLAYSSLKNSGREAVLTEITKAIDISGLKSGKKDKI